MKKNCSILISTIIAISGWGAVHLLEAERDRQNKLRDIRIEYLVNAYRNLSDASQRTPVKNSPHFRQIEAALADIQLFGTKSQIEKVHCGINEYSKTATIPLDPLLNDLRDSLRTELNLSHIQQNVHWLRMEGAPLLPNAEPHNKP
jgi:hypothetical protein